MAKIIGNTTATTMPLPDWSQNNPAKADYIKNRPFYDGDPVETELLDVNAVLTEFGAIWNRDEMHSDIWVAQLSLVTEFAIGKTYTVLINGIKYSDTARNLQEIIGTSSDYLVLGDQEALMDENIDAFTYSVVAIPEENIIIIEYKGSEPPTEFKIYSLEQGIKTIDEKYIPDTIARTKDIPKQAQPDWDETDETNPSYIRNKPDENDALLLVAEMGLVQPVSTASGDILTDNNNNVIIL